MNAEQRPVGALDNRPGERDSQREDERRLWSDAPVYYFGSCKTCQRIADDEGRALLVAGRNIDSTVCLDCFVTRHRCRHPNYRRRRGGRSALSPGAVGLTAVLSAALLGASTAAASSAKLTSLAARERRQERTILRDHFTLRFFERHPQLLYRGPHVRRARAWRTIVHARAEIAWTRLELSETRAVLRSLRRPALAGRAAWRPRSLPAHYLLWLCVDRNERTGWGDAGWPYWGGLQLGAWFLGAYRHPAGTPDRWSPLVQMWVAELAYRHEAAQGRAHLVAWFNGQWPPSRGRCPL